jgi:prolipoprotein diacylglyceryltransferase
MTARVYGNIYDLNSPFISATAPATAAQQAVTAQQRRAFLEQLAENRLFNASVVLAVFAAIVYLIATMLAPSPLGQVTGAQNMPLWLAVIAGGLAVAGAVTAVLVAAVMRVRA